MICALLLLCASCQVLGNPEFKEHYDTTERVDNPDFPSTISVLDIEKHENGFNKRSLESQAENDENDDLDTAEALVFRPLFGSRILVNRRLNFRRRFPRNVVNPSDDLFTDETLVFRPFFRRRFAYPRRRFPYYYYY